MNSCQWSESSHIVERPSSLKCKTKKFTSCHGFTEWHFQHADCQLFIGGGDFVCKFIKCSIAVQTRAK